MSEKRAFKAQAMSIGSLTILLAVALALAATGTVFGQSANQGAAQQAAGQTAAPQAGAEAPRRRQSEVQKYGQSPRPPPLGLGAIGAGIAIGNVGSAAMGAIAKPRSPARP